MKFSLSFPLIISVVIYATLLSIVNSKGKIDVNQATHIQLEQVPGIGPTLAKKIIIEREKRGGFRTIEDLLKVRGIGRKHLLKFKRYLTVIPLSDSNELSRFSTRVNN